MTSIVDAAAPDHLDGGEPGAPPASDDGGERAARRGALIALGVGVVVVVVARLWGQHVEWVVTEGRANIGAAPFFGRWNVIFRWWLLAGVAVGVVGVWLAPRFARTWSWGRVLVGTWALHAAWAVSLAASDGLHRLTTPLTSRFEYFRAIDDVEAAGGVSDYLSGYVAGLADSPLHVRSHPPGMVLFYWALDRVGLSGPGWAAVAVIGFGTSVVVAVLLALRAVAGIDVARRAAPLVALTPSVIWVASSADAVFAAITAWGVALLVIAARRPARRVDSVRMAAMGGMVLSLALFFSYGAVLMLGVPAVVVLAARRWDVLAGAVVAALGVTAMFTVMGFWWFEGLFETMEFYEASSAEFRPYDYSLVGNPAIVALSIGTAGVAGLGSLAATWRRHRSVLLLVVPVLVGIIGAALSGLSTAETERIWLPFVPWLMLAGVALPTRWVRPLLAGSVLIGVVLQMWLQTPW
ncbi:MAG: hypothetical protein AAGA99_03560 [Actinomycetota bacterium]